MKFTICRPTATNGVNTNLFNYVVFAGGVGRFGRLSLFLFDLLTLLSVHVPYYNTKVSTTKGTGGYVFYMIYFISLSF